MTGHTNFLQSLGWAILNSLWQLALLWVIYQIISSIFSKVKSSIKSALAFSLLITGFTSFIYTFLAVYTDQETDSIVLSFALVTTDGNQQLNEWLQQTLPLASILYLVLLLLPVLQFVRNYRYVQVIRKFGLTKMNVEWRMFVKKVAIQMNIKKTVKIWVSGFVSSPVTIGFLKPVILMPLAAINQLTTQQVEAILLHELSHIKRFDYLINIIINLIQTILYFNPFVKAFVKIIETEREKSCDSMVLQFQYDSHEYATALLKLEKAETDNKPMAIAATGKKNNLLTRIELIMGVKKKTAISFNKLAKLMAGILCIIAINAFLLVSKPENGTRLASLNHIFSSFNFVAGLQPYVKKVVDVTENPVRINNRAKQTPAASIEPSFVEYVSSVISPALITASLEMANRPELKKYQEDQVERTMLASKKVLENVQWKAVEKSIADVFNDKEKDELKATYEKEMEKIDWKKWENNLRQAYNKIDWEKINSQLSSAVSQVRFDSLQLVYNKAISKLQVASKELSLNDLKGIPDTDITLKEIECKKMEVQKALNELKKVRNKKIVHL